MLVTLFYLSHQCYTVCVILIIFSILDCALKFTGNKFRLSLHLDFLADLFHIYSVTRTLTVQSPP
jgi:hypothetical protein